MVRAKLSMGPSVSCFKSGTNPSVRSCNLWIRWRCGSSSNILDELVVLPVGVVSRGPGWGCRGRKFSVQCGLKRLMVLRAAERTWLQKLLCEWNLPVFASFPPRCIAVSLSFKNWTKSNIPILFWATVRLSFFLVAVKTQWKAQDIPLLPFQTVYLSVIFMLHSTRQQG